MIASVAESEVERMLQASRVGDAAAWNRLLDLVYVDLKRIAHRHRAEHAASPTLGTTGLVHESYLRLVGAQRADLESRRHFFNLASRVMRQVMCDYARYRLRTKRGAGAAHENLDEVDVAEQADMEQMVFIDELLGRIEQANPSWARIVECRYFAGLTDAETAEALDLTLRTVQRQWQEARSWLAPQLRR